jgi:hypothetical protein
MRTRARSQFAVSALVTYCRQRIGPAFFGLAVFLILFSQSPFRPAAQIVISFAFVLGFLFVFRLYDDLSQTPYDIGKPERSYTDPSAGKALAACLIVFFPALAGFAYLLSPRAAMVLVLFIAVNHLVYRNFIGRKTLSGFLPMLKYPVLHWLLRFAESSSSNGAGADFLTAAGLFAAFVAFESLDDESFAFPGKYAGIMQAIAFALILFGSFSLTAALIGGLLLSLSLVGKFVWSRGSRYIFLVCLLAFRFIVQHYEF